MLFGVFIRLSISHKSLTLITQNFFILLLSVAPEDHQERKKIMYPKVKVKEQDDDDLMTVNAMDFESLSTISEYEDDSPTSVVRIPDSYVPGPTSLSQGESTGKKKTAVNSTENIRASPIPPPRAVLSSPDNDGLTRSKNKAKSETVSCLRDHNMCKNRHIRCKVIPGRSGFVTTKTTKQEAKVETHKPNIKGKTRTGADNTRKQAHQRRPKPEWI